MNDVTADEVKAAMIAAGIERVDHHACGFCRYMTNFQRQGEQLFFDPGCDCSGGGIEPREWSSAAEWINMQSRPEVRERLRVAFGFPATVSEKP